MKELVYHRFLLPAADSHPTRSAVVDGAARHTFAEHVDRVLRIGDALRRAGVRRGDRFAVMALNCHQFLELYHASLLTGAVINPLNLRLAPKELEFILADSGAKVCFADGFFAGAVDAARAAAGVDQIVLIGPGDVPHDTTYDELIGSGDAVVPEEPEEDDAAILMYTGGTTGLPKGVVLESRALMLDLYKVAAQWNIDEDYVFLHQGPMFHAASIGATLAVPARGGTSAIIPVFTPEAAMDSIEAHRVTMTLMVPVMISMLLDDPSFDPARLGSLRTLVYGASPMPLPLVERLLDTLPEVDVFQGYGMTENCGLLTVLTAADHRRRGELLRSAGRPAAGTVVSIQDEDGKVLPAGETGEVCGRAGNFMRGYWNRDEETADAFRDGWYHTGDAGYLDEDGNLFLVDRVKDMIVSGGENIYSVEVENAIASHPGVDQVAVIGVPSERWGEEVKAIVVPKPGYDLDAEAVQTWARERIAGYKVPKTVDFRAEPLPLSGAMKVLKRELRAPYWDGKDGAVQ